jgi:hypothetical protein
LAKCALDLTDPKFVIVGDASDSDLQAGLKELQLKLANQDHKLSGFFNHPMPGFPEYQNKIWKWDFAPAGASSSTRKGWRLLAYVPNPKSPEPIPARAFLCYDKDQQPKGNPAQFLAEKLKVFLVKVVVKPLATEDRFRRQHLSDGKLVSMCYECFHQIFSDDDDAADIAESTHECPAK